MILCLFLPLNKKEIKKKLWINYRIDVDFSVISKYLIVASNKEVRLSLATYVHACILIKTITNLEKLELIWPNSSAAMFLAPTNPYSFLNRSFYLFLLPIGAQKSETMNGQRSTSTLT